MIAPPCWTERALSLVGDLDTDASALAGFTEAGERVLGALPAKVRRDDEERHMANEIHQACRRARMAFLALHATAVYDRLTADRTRFMRVRELADVAAIAFPGLAPTAAQLFAERAVLQVNKEGREVDQGILFAAFLASPGVGTHLIRAMLRPTERAERLLGDFRRTGEADLGKVTVRRIGSAGHVTLHDPHHLNAEDMRLVDDLEVAVDLVLLDPGSRVGVLRGAPATHPKYAGRRVFSAGINLIDLWHGRIPYVGFMLGRELGCVHKLLRGLEPETGTPVEKPWVAAVDTFAIGGGTQLLLVCDHVIVADDSYLSLPAAQEGIVPGLANLRLTRHGGARMARSLLLGGARLAATDPVAIALVDRVVPAAGVDDAVDDAVAALGSPAIVANRRMLRAAEEPLDLFRAFMAEFARLQAERLYSDDVHARLERSWAHR
ncbi:enoyl-CoA hydratase/isomerase family protein [Amycolatopsis keratiniphila]|uniref:Enoyl-CoA hydratase/isomerase n=1 Tax=Amycolatopsis keratiniphila TaxID=129921 RepID=R4T6C2_9PSEU|nr:enoyl-CoA hydratase/isomerase family protein [Amycolatopsis keratiniphila]AGM07911.1 enoyl-CoA hydratase/isomerase [Amycolatopsis keratiniphila]